MSLHWIVLAQDYHCSQNAVVDSPFICPYIKIVLTKSVLTSTTVAFSYWAFMLFLQARQMLPLKLQVTYTLRTIVCLQDFAHQLAVITGFDKVSLQPNSGAAGEYAGLMAIRGFNKANGEEHRNVCIIPTSAHGTNPASAVMAGMKVVAIGVDSKGNIDIEQLRKKCQEHKDK